MHIILGASSGIGKVFFNTLTANHCTVLGTGYQSLDGGRLFYFDSLAHDFKILMEILQIQNPSDIAWIHFFYGSSNLNWVIRHPEESQAINVDSKLLLIEEAIKKNINIGFTSTDQVFGGDKNSYGESSPPSPSTLYGIQKVAIEKFIIKNTKKYLIVRFGPNIFADTLKGNCRVTSVYNNIIQKKSLMAQDVRFSLTEVSDTCRAYHALIQNCCLGIFHIASSESSSWTELAEKIKNLSLIGDQMAYKPCFLKELDFPEARPKNTCLNNQKLSGSINLKFGNINQAIKKKVYLLDNQHLLETTQGSS